MKIFVCDDHAGYWPVGVATVVVAPDENSARGMLNAELKSRALADDKSQPFTLREVSSETPSVNMLCDGNY